MVGIDGDDAKQQAWEGALRIVDCQSDSRSDHSRHLALGDFALGENGGRVIAGDSGKTAPCQLRRPKRGDRNELERSHQERRTDHRAPAVRPKASDCDALADARLDSRTTDKD